MQRIYRAFFQDPRVHFLSVSVDPLHDTPEVLATYANDYLANPTRWHFVTASGMDALKPVLLNGFRVGSKDNPTLHTTQFVLMDTQNRIRGYFNGLKLSEIDALITAITELLQSQHGPL